jgi:RNA polymerase sigma factor for flagellar operon FliA
MSTTREHSELWAAYHRTRSDDDRNALAVVYLPIVKRAAERMLGRLVASVEVDDLIQWGSQGLLEAIAAFDCGRKNKFATFAMLRVQGAMYDGLRKVAARSRNVIFRSKVLKLTEEALADELGRHPAPEEVAARLKLTPDEYQIRCRRRQIHTRSLDSELVIEKGRQTSIYSTLPDLREHDPAVNIERRDFADAILRYILDNFRVTEALIFRLHYLEQMTMKDIGPLLGRSGCSVCMLHKAVLKKLRTRYAA